MNESIKVAAIISCTILVVVLAMFITSKEDDDEY